MSLNPKKKSKGEPLALKSKRLLLSAIRFIVSIYHGYITLHVWSIVFLLIFAILTHNIVTISGLLLVWGFLVYILFPYLERWLEKHEGK